MKTTSTAVHFGSFTVYSSSGIQASGEMGLRIWMNGLTALNRTLFKPNKMPSMMATIEAARNPAANRETV